MAADFEIPTQAVAVADGSGLATATVTFQAPNVGPRGLKIVSIALKVTPSPPIPIATVYRGVVSDFNIMDRKSAGDRGTFNGTEDVLYMGQLLIVQWTSAAIGALCTATLRGSAVAPR